MASSSELIAVKTVGWQAGFKNMFSKENGSWWRTRTWLVQTLIWLVVLNGMLSMVIRVPPQVQEKMRQQIQEDRQNGGEVNPISQLTGNSVLGQGLMIFLLFSGMALPVVAIIMGQEGVIGEKHMGTAAWVLSKPVSRKAFLLAKLLANGIGILVTGVVIQSALAYLQLSLKLDEPLPLVEYCGAVGLVFLNILFYLTLTVMLSTFFHKRGPVLGIGLALGLGGSSMIQIAPKFIIHLLPWTFLVPGPGTPTPLALSVALGAPLPTILPIISTAVLCVVFTAVALWRFEREEF